MLKLNSKGDDVISLQKALKNAGFDPGEIDGYFFKATENALKAFQKSNGLLVDGIAGPVTLTALSLEVKTPKENFLSDTALLKLAVKMFPGVPVKNIETNLPHVIAGLNLFNLTDRPMILMALATIRAETSQFRPISEGKSKYNTSPKGHPFNLYDNRKDIGNRGGNDGALYKGRGYIQLTGRSNYYRIGAIVGVDLVNNPEEANDPAIAGKILAAFLKNNETKIKHALLENDLKQARRLVNGGSHGLSEFVSAYQTGSIFLKK
jgi:putative chitinase